MTEYITITICQIYIDTIGGETVLGVALKIVENYFCVQNVVIDKVVAYNL